MSNKEAKATSPFDFNQLDLAALCDEPFEFELVNPQTEKGLGVFISVVGSESATFQKYLRDEQNKARKEAFEKQRKGGDPDKFRSIEDDEDTLCRGVAAAMTGWRTIINHSDILTAIAEKQEPPEPISKPVIMWGGKGLEFTEHNAVLWLKQFKWARIQVNQQTGDLGNFTKR